MTRILSSLIVVGVLFASVTACGTQKVDESHPAVINANCPSTGDAVDPEVPAYDWNGKMVGFCCGECEGKFAKLNDEEKAAALAKVGTVLDG